MMVEETTGVRGGGEFLGFAGKRPQQLKEKMTGLWKEEEEKEVEEVELKVREVARRLDDVEGGIDLEVEKVVEEKELKRGEIEWRVEEVVKVVEPRVEGVNISSAINLRFFRSDLISTLQLMLWNGYIRKSISQENSDFDIFLKDINAPPPFTSCRIKKLCLGPCILW